MRLLRRPTPSSWDLRVPVPRVSEGRMCMLRAPPRLALSSTSSSATLPPPRGAGSRCPGSALPPQPSRAVTGPGSRSLLRWGPIPGAQGGSGAPHRSPPGSGPAPPTRPDTWKPPEGRLDLATTPGPACPPTPQFPGAPPPHRPTPQTYSKTCSEVQIFMVPAACAVSRRRNEEEATLASAPPPRHPAGCAARTRRRARRGGRPDALPHALSRPGFCASLARGATKPRPLAPGAPRRRSSGGSARARRGRRCAAQARHAAGGPPPARASPAALTSRESWDPSSGFLDAPAGSASPVRSRPALARLALQTC